MKSVALTIASIKKDTEYLLGEKERFSKNLADIQAKIDSNNEVLNILEAHRKAGKPSVGLGSTGIYNDTTNLISRDQATQTILGNSEGVFLGKSCDEDEDSNV